MEPDHRLAALPALESLLVNEFRAYQTLVGLTRQERVALAKSDAHGLTALVDQKAVVLDEIRRLESARSRLLSEAADWLAPGTPLSLADMLPRLEPALARRLDRLSRGILALVDELRELTRGNHALAASALDYLEDVRAFLLTLDGPAARYSPVGMPLAPVAALSWDVERTA